jgi:hypothetical protein
LHAVLKNAGLPLPFSTVYPEYNGAIIPKCPSEGEKVNSGYIHHDRKGVFPGHLNKV